MSEHSAEMYRLRREREVYRGLLALGDVSAIEPFLEEALRLVVDVSGAEQGYLEIRDAGGREQVWSTTQGGLDRHADEVRSKISSGIIAESLSTGATVVTHSAILDERFERHESVRKAGIEAVLCSPIGGDARLGVIYLQGRSGGGPFADEDRDMTELLARHLAPLADRLLLRKRYEESRDATQHLRDRFRLDGIVGRSRALAQVLELAMQAAPLDITVLITGPSGTGKSQLAHAIHNNSARCDEAFVELNCAAFQPTLIENELFGARAGSHSEARVDHPGKVSAAQGGTLFLDEIAEIPVSAQAKLLQLIQTRQYYPLGAKTPEVADVRLIVATNADLEEEVKAKRFREDLFYRINVVPIEMPSLQARREDIGLLADALLERAVRQYSIPPLRLSGAAQVAIATAEWPGNVRQLDNAIQAGAVRSHGAGLSEVGRTQLFPERCTQQDDHLSFQEATRQFQRELLLGVLRETGWNATETAHRLEIARSYVYQLIQTFELRRERDGES